MDEEKYNGEFETVEPEVVEIETKICKHCGRTLSAGYDFCTYCGKSQKDVPAVKESGEKSIPKTPPEKAKKKIEAPLLFAFSIVAFVIAAITFVISIINLMQTGAASSAAPFGSFFGSGDNSELIISMIHIIANLLTSILFTIIGFALLFIRKTQ